MDIGKNLEKMFSIEGKTVILTGAAGGICSELAVGLASGRSLQRDWPVQAEK